MPAVAILAAARIANTDGGESSRMRGKRWIQEIALGVVATPPTVAAFVFVLGLMRFAPEPRGAIRQLDQDDVECMCPPQLDTNSGGGSALVSLFVFLYRRSLFSRYLNRNGPRCCFLPSCTEYAVLAARKYGLLQGLLLIGDRFRRCSPAREGSYVDFP